MKSLIGQANDISFRTRKAQARASSPRCCFRLPGAARLLEDRVALCAKRSCLGRQTEALWTTRIDAAKPPLAWLLHRQIMGALTGRAAFPSHGLRFGARNLGTVMEPSCRARRQTVASPRVARARGA
jgi:hypothetical protein